MLRFAAGDRLRKSISKGRKNLVKKRGVNPLLFRGGVALVRSRNPRGRKWRPRRAPPSPGAPPSEEIAHRRIMGARLSRAGPIPLSCFILGSLRIRGPGITARRGPRAPRGMLADLQISFARRDVRFSRSQWKKSRGAAGTGPCDVSNTSQDRSQRPPLQNQWKSMNPQGGRWDLFL